MLQQTQLKYKLGETQVELTSRTGLAVFSEFMIGIGMILDKQMPKPCSNRGEAWRYVEMLMLMMYGGDRQIYDMREIEKRQG